jgi:hypothetical protein
MRVESVHIRNYSLHTHLHITVRHIQLAYQMGVIFIPWSNAIRCDHTGLVEYDLRLWFFDMLYNADYVCVENGLLRHDVGKLRTFDQYSIPEMDVTKGLTKPYGIIFALIGIDA